MLGVCYAVLLGLLAAGGHQPAMTHGLPAPADLYYIVAATYIIPLVVVLWQIFGRVAHAASGAGGPPSATLAALAPAWAIPLTAGFVIPDIIVYVGWGHAAIGGAMKYYTPIAIIAARLSLCGVSPGS